MTDAIPAEPRERALRLRYAGDCRHCGTPLAARARARWDPHGRTLATPGGIALLNPGGLARTLRRPGPRSPDQVQHLATVLAQRLPVA